MGNASFQNVYPFPSAKKWSNSCPFYPTSLAAEYFKRSPSWIPAAEAVSMYWTCMDIAFTNEDCCQVLYSEPLLQLTLCKHQAGAPPHPIQLRPTLLSPNACKTLLFQDDCKEADLGLLLLTRFTQRLYPIWVKPISRGGPS